MKIATLNVRGLGCLKKERKRFENEKKKIRLIRGSIATIKPDILILTETKLKRNEQYLPITCKYEIITDSRAENGASKGIQVLKKKGDKMEYTDLIKSEHYTLGIIKSGKYRFLLTSLYAPCNSDNEAARIYEEVFMQIQHFSQIHTLENQVIAGDFNINMNNPIRRPRAFEKLTEIMNRYNLIDRDKHHLPTWMGDGERKTQSKLDLILSNMSEFKYYSRGPQITDHNIISLTDTNKWIRKEKVVRTSIILSQEFETAADKIINRTLIDESNNIIEGGVRFEELIQLKPQELDTQLNITTEARVRTFNYLTHKIKRLHDHILRKINKEKRERIERLEREIENLDRQIKNTQEREWREELITEKINKTNIVKNIINERVEKEEIQIEKYVKMKDGSSLPITFREIKDQKLNKEIREIIHNEISYKTDEEIARIMTETYRQKVNTGRTQTKTLQEHLREKELRFGEITEKTEPKTPGFYHSLKQIQPQVLNNNNDRINENNNPLEEEMRRLIQNQVNEETEEYEEQIDQQVQEQILEDREKDTLQQDIQATIKNAKKRSSPGPSGITISFYQFLFNRVPKTMTEFYWKYIQDEELQNQPAYTWMKNRKIIYIHKKGKNPNSSSSYRPLSLFEAGYKIATKILTDKLQKEIEKSIHPNQYGFMQKRLASTPINITINTIQHAIQHNQPLQVISLDTASAFDAIYREVIYQNMEQVNIDPELIRKMRIINENTTASVQVNRIESEKFPIDTGIGQGNPPSALLYIIGEDFNHRIINSKDKEWYYKMEDGTTQLPSIFADDKTRYTAMNKIEDLDELFSEYEEIQQIAGLELNVRKTQILAINTPQELIDQITERYGNIVKEEITILGIKFRKNLQETLEANNRDIIAKIIKTGNMMNRKQVPILKKAKHIQAGLYSKTMYQMQALPFTSEQRQKLQKQVIKSCWSTEAKYNRHKIARDRLEAPLESGGLAISGIDTINEAHLANTAILQLHETFEENLKYSLGKQIKYAFHNNGVENPKFVFQRGSQYIKKIAGKIKEELPIISQGIENIAKLAEKIEVDEKWRWTSPIIGNILVSKENTLNQDTEDELDRLGIKNWIQLIETMEPQEDRDNRLTSETIKGNIGKQTNMRNADMIEQIDISQTEKVKMKRIVKKLREMDRKDRNEAQEIHPILDIRQDIIKQVTNKNLIQHLYLEKVKISKIIKSLRKEELGKIYHEPPARKTRRLEHIQVPTNDIYRQAYKKIIKTNTSTYNKSLSFEILNRTVWTNSKANKSKMQNRDRENRIIINEEGDPQINDGLCHYFHEEDERETIEHLFFQCETYSLPIWDLIHKTIKKIYNQMPENNNNKIYSEVNIKHILYHEPIIQKKNRTIINQINTLLVITKARIYQNKQKSIRNRGYDQQRIAIHTLKAIQETISDLRSHRKATAFMEKMEQELTHMLNDW